MVKKFHYSLWEITRRLLAIAAPVKGLLAASTLVSIIGNLAQMGLMGFGSLALLAAFSGQKHRMIIFLILTAFSAFLIILGRYLEGVISHGGAYSLLASMRIHLFEIIRRLAPACLMDREKGDLLNIAVSDIETIEFFFAHTIGPLFTVILLPCITLALALFIHPLFAALLLPVYLVVSVFFPLTAVKIGRPIGIRYRERLGKMKSLVLESVYGLKDIQIFGHGLRRLDLVKEQNREINRAAHGLTLHRQTVSAAPTFFVYLARILILAGASYLGTKTLGDMSGVVLLSFVTAASFSSTQSLTTVVSSLLETYASAERLFLLEDTIPEVTETEHPAEIGKIKKIEFENVDFSYSGSPEKDSKSPSSLKILDKFSLSITGQEKIGIVGESGAGKSTILRLLLRFWNPTGGRILINDIPLEDVSLTELHRRIAVLEQDTFLFNGTIAENIALGYPDASPEQIIAAAQGAGIHDLIRTLPEGYHTPMGQMGNRLSGGEKQRIGIARTLIMNPDVIVMDEPTSSLDVLHEKELLKTLSESCSDKMLLIVSHRPSTLTGCTRIVRLTAGHAEEETGDVFGGISS